MAPLPTRIASLSLVTLAFSLAGCSDSPAPADAALDLGADAAPDAPPDVAQDAAPDVAQDVAQDVARDAAADAPADAAADVPADAPLACALTRVLVTTSDFRTGGYALGTVEPPALMEVGSMSPDQDHVPVESGCTVFNLLRGNDEVAVLDAARLPAIARRIPLRTGAAPADGGMAMPYQANPYGVLSLAPTRAYVVQYALPRVAVIDPTREGAAAVTGSIDLSPLRSPMDVDPGGAMEAAGVVRSGGRVFVALQNLNSFAPVANGTLAVIDPAADRLVDADASTPAVDPVRLTGRNPVSMALTPGGRVVVAEAGVVAFMAPQALDGVIEAVDPATLRPAGMRVTEMQLGGDVGDVVMLDENRGWALVTRLAAGDAGAGDVRVVEFDLAAGSAGRTVFTGSALGGMARDPMGRVWVLDRATGAAGVRVFRADGTPVTAMALPSGMRPPAGLAFVP